MKLYRYDIRRGEIADLSTLRLSEFDIVKETPKGYWIKPAFEGRKFVLKGNGKRYAYPTHKLALESLRARTKRRKAIISSQLRICDVGLRIVENRLNKLDENEN